jgi:4'-phosphopantetheinyl transferase
MRSLCAVWLANVSDWRDGIAALEQLLAPAEHARAAQFRFAEDGTRFVLGRGLLRLGVRRYAPEFADALELHYSARGRPLLPAETGLDFSISHTRDRVAIAFAHGAHIGVDLEYQQAELDVDELADRIFSAEDLAAFHALSTNARRAAFFRAWTRKEAYLKAIGEGIATGLKDVTVALNDVAVTTLTDRRDPEGSSVWRLHVLDAGPEYAGCIAWDDPHRSVEVLAAAWKTGELDLARAP